jgi:hypothetical protein
VEEAAMWVHTEDGELVNLEHVEFIRVEANDEDDQWEVRAYPVQVGEPDEDLYYLLVSDDSEIQARSKFETIVSAILSGSGLADLRTAFS